MERNSCTWLIRYSGILFLVATLAISPWLAGAQQAGGAKPAVPAAAGGKDLVAVLDLDAVGASKVEASAMTDRLREELLRTGKFTLVDRSQMQAVLDEQALQQTGCTSQECAVQVGKVLGVRKIVSGKVTKIADTQWLLNVTVVDVETAETLRAESLRYRGDYFSMLDEGIVTLVAKLSAPSGAKPDLTAQLGAQQQARTAAQPAQPPPTAETKKSSSVWWWIIGGVLVAGVAVAAAGGSSKKSSSSSSAPSSCSSNCSTVSYSW